MATKKKPIELSANAKKPIAEVRADYQKVLNELEWYKNSMRCSFCGKVKLMSKDNFYTSTDPMMSTVFVRSVRTVLKKLPDV